MPMSSKWWARIAGGRCNEPVDLRMYLKLGDTTLSETWLYQYFPE